MRKLTITPPKVVVRDDPEHTLHERSYTLLTPLLGGGVTPNEADPVTVIRVPEVRGQLRFWWRACCAGRYNSVEELAAAESELWGNTEHDSRIKIELLDDPHATSAGEAIVAFTLEMNKNGRLDPVPAKDIAPYAAFPLLPDKQEQTQSSWKSEEVWRDVRFKLGLRYAPKFEDDVARALWAWETFGGLGARTRRGFGAAHFISSADLLPSRDAERALRRKLRERCELAGALTAIPVLTPEILLKVTAAFDDPIVAWKHLLQKLQAFRQARYGSKYGKSKWPEANEIRRLHGRPYRLPDDVPASRLVQRFPRAAFGLPINFHMPHDPVPENQVLEGKPDSQRDIKYERLASRLILRPVACKDGKYVGLAVVLQGPEQPPNGLRLRNANGDPQVRMDLDTDDAQKIQPLRDNPDVLQAFLDTL